MRAIVSPPRTGSPGRGASRGLSGEAVLTESWDASDCVTFAVSGTLRGFNRYPLVDALTGSTLVGARHILVDCADLLSADALALVGLDRVRRFVEASGGSFAVRGLHADLETAWSTLAS